MILYWMHCSKMKKKAPFQVFTGIELKWLFAKRSVLGLRCMCQEKSMQQIMQTRWSMMGGGYVASRLHLHFSILFPSLRS